MSTPPDDPAPEPPDAAAGLDATMRAAIQSVALSGAALAVGAFAVVDARAALGVAIGGALATANLWAFARIGQAFLSGKGRPGPWVAAAMLKLVLLFGAVWFLVKKNDIVSGIALAVGYAALPFGITLGTLTAKPHDKA